MTTINAVGNGLSGATGTGNFVGATSPTLVTPVLGTPTSGTLTNCTGLPPAGVTGTACTKMVCGSFNYNTANASGSTSVVNTLTFQPKAVIFMGGLNGSSSVWVGMDDGTTPQNISNDFVDADNTWALSPFGITAPMQTGSGASGKITSFASNGFTVTWTKTGSPTGTIQVMYLAMG